MRIFELKLVLNKINHLITTKINPLRIEMNHLFDDICFYDKIYFPSKTTKKYHANDLKQYEKLRLKHQKLLSELNVLNKQKRCYQIK